MNGLNRLWALGALGERYERMVGERATVTVAGKPVWRALLDIAAQIECEQAEAVAWVESHGGLEALKNSLSALELLAEGIEIDTGLALYDESPKERCVALRNEVKSRLMPEGMEWPRFEDGEPVRFGCEFEFGGDVDVVESVTFHCAGSPRFNYGLQDSWKRVHGLYVRGELVKRPAPKVTDADGVEIRVGDTVWGIQSAHEFVVGGFVTDDSNGAYTVEAHFANEFDLVYLRPDQLTHRAPALGADGKPLREGETVFGVTRGIEMTVDKVSSNAVHLHDAKGLEYKIMPQNLTHERPDSWERLEDDAITLDNAISEYEIQPRIRAERLVRRAEKLAGVSE